MHAAIGMPCAAFDHQPIARTQPLDRQLEAAETIAFVRIGACQVEDEIRPLPLEAPRRAPPPARARYSSSRAPSGSMTSRSLVSFGRGSSSRRAARA